MVSRWLGGLAAGQQGLTTAWRCSGLGFTLAAGAALAALALSPAAQAGERGLRQSRATAASTVAADEDASNARVIVKYRAGSELARRGVVAGRAQHAAHLGRRLALPMADGRSLGAHVQGLRGLGLSSRQLAARLSAQPDVEWAVMDQRRTATALPNDPYFGPGQTSVTPAVGQWYLRAPDSTLISAINAPAAWELTQGNAAITVAVLDTGVRFDHPDLASKLWPGYDFVRVGGSNDGDGRDADASDPGDWTVASDTCGASESSWHGTQVSGLIAAATDNGQGMASIGRNVMVLPVRVLGKCGGFDTDILAAMLWSAGLSTDTSLPANPHPAQVINLSLGSVGTCSAAYLTVLDQLTAAKVTVVAAAGNNTGLAVDVPGNCAGVIAVGGVRHAGTKVGYSGLGPQVALAAPAGNCVNETGTCLYPLLTTDNAGGTAPGANTYSDGSKPSLGTSFSAPLVAGTVGLMLSVDPTLTPARVKTILQATVRPFPTTGAQTVGAVSCHEPTTTVQVECYCTTSTCGAGLLDAGAALVRVAAGIPAPTAVISASSASPVVGNTVALDGGGSSAAFGRTLSSYRWAITSGAALATLTVATDGRSATLVTSAVGEVVLSLTVTDNTGASRSTSQTLTILAVPVVVVTPAASGGGALGGGWLLGLAAVVGLLARWPRREAAG